MNDDLRMIHALSYVITALIVCCFVEIVTSSLRIGLSII